MIELEQLRQLVAIADFHTISAAADALHLSQPALTRSMQRLEHELEVELFHRRRNRLGLNQTGETAVGFARILLKDADTYVDQIRAYASRLSTISIGSSTPAPMWDLAAKLGNLFPGFTVTMENKDETSLKEGLMDGRYQFIIVKEVPDNTNILSHPWIEERLAIEVPKTHPLASLDHITFSDLSAYPALGLREPSIWWDLLESFGIHLIFQEDPSILNDLKRSSNLVSVSSDLACKWIEPPPWRVVIPISDPSAVTSFYICTLKNNSERFVKLFPMEKTAV